MDQEELIEHIRSLVVKKIPYKSEPPYSLEEGFNCYAWSEYIYNLYEINVDKDIKGLRRKFIIIKEKPKFLDIPLFYAFVAGTRHIGVMLNDTEMSQCSHNTNGVAISDITRSPWRNTLKYFYRLKDEI